jgi:hypothetical protein
MNNIKLILLLSLVNVKFALFAQNPNEQKIDSVLNMKMDVLAKIAYSTDWIEIDSIHNTKEYVLFFERLTGIPSNADDSFVGKTYASKEELLAWRDWIWANKSQLIWEPKGKTVIKVKEE